MGIVASLFALHTRHVVPDEEFADFVDGWYPSPFDTEEGMNPSPSPIVLWTQDYTEYIDDLITRLAESNDVASKNRVNLNTQPIYYYADN